MNAKKKILSVALAASLAAVAVVSSSLAYFTDTETKTNEFTVGNVDITLTEEKWDADLNNKDLIPGKTIPKDPTITVDADSETAYTFMKVELSDDFVDLLTAYATAEGIEDPAQVIDDWFVSEVQPKVMEMGDNYVILGVLSPKAAGESVTYFDEVTIPAAVTQEMIKADGVYTIDITAYAIQAEGFYNEEDKFASRQAAFDALFAE